MASLTRSGSSTSSNSEEALYKKRNSFWHGYTITKPDQVLLFDSANGGDGNYYKWAGSLSVPKVVPAGSTPSSTGGISSTAWVNVGDARMKTSFFADLISTAGASLIGFTQGVTSNFAARTVMDKLRDTVYIEDFYKPEDGADWGHALNRAFSEFSNHTAFTIQFRASDYAITTPAVYNGQATVMLEGRGGTRLLLNGTGTAANISITSVRRVVITNLQFEVTAPTVNGVKTGVLINVTGQDRSHTMNNVVATVTIEANRSVLMFDIVNPGLMDIQAVYVRYFGPNQGAIVGSNNIAWRMRASNNTVCTDSRFFNCQIIGSELGFFVDLPLKGSNAFLEGMLWSGCTIVGAIEGVKAVGHADNYRVPMFSWIGGHIMAYGSCMVLSNVSQCHIESSFFYLEHNAAFSASGGRWAITLLNTEEVYISNMGIHMFNVPENRLGGVFVGDGCRITHLSHTHVFSIGHDVFAVLSMPNSKWTRAFDCAVTSNIVEETSAISLNGTGDKDLGGNDKIQ